MAGKPLSADISYPTTEKWMKIHTGSDTGSNTGSNTDVKSTFVTGFKKTRLPRTITNI